MRIFIKKKVLSWGMIFLFLLIAGSGFLFETLLPYQEKNAYLYDYFGRRFERVLKEEKIKDASNLWLFLGDSQLISGLRPADLEKISGKKILFLPRPSEQPEGMLTELEELLKVRIRPEKVFLDASYFNTADVDVVPVHRSLVLNFDPFRWDFYSDPIKRKFYFRSLGDGVFFALSRIFPLLKLNSNLSAELRPIARTEQFSEIDPRLADMLAMDPIGRWKSNRIRNEGLRKELDRNEGFMEWNRDEPYTGECVPNRNPKPLPQVGWERSYSKVRSSSLDAWKKIFDTLEKEQIPYRILVIPSRPDFVAVLGKHTALAGFLDLLKTRGITVLRPEEEFPSSDFGDYTHLNACGNLKLTRWFAKTRL
ncbi:hypothetical protein EHO61_09425 [Leptospira fluminis]|uniref:DUF1574 domain-containing protein n=1 Tax=Leptospira fluminis TaxID=2484979 RepID=A0A4R9GPF9_9LEPT|nr:hypothetical protein [Leptospira fluminis]TGK18809.1 hypothetical protein EHO61_09425 [Leptospira fluminis]